MKNFAFILVAAMLLSTTNSFASQPIEAWTPRPGEKIKLLSNEEFFAKADYIIEAKSAGWEFLTSYDAGGNYSPDEIYTSTFVIVTYIYKNDETMRISPGDTLRFFRKGGWIYQPVWEGGVEQLWSPQPVDYDTGEMGYVPSMEDEHQSIYFMKKSDLPENPDVSKRSKHHKVCMLQDITRASIKIMGNGRMYNGSAWGLNDLHFASRYELYKYMEQFEGVKVPLSDTNHMRWHLNDEAFNEYLKERNIRDPRNPQVKDSVRSAREMRFQERREYIEKKKNEQELLNNTKIHYT